MPADGGEMRMVTAGGEVNNWLNGWSEDGRYLSYSSKYVRDYSCSCASE